MSCAKCRNGNSVPEMRLVIYKGPACNLSRFGEVKSGQQLELTEQEFGTVEGDPNYKLINDFKFRTAEFTPPLPGPTPHYDLRRIDWTNPRLAQKMDKRGKSELLNIGRAMKEIGLAVDVATRFEKRVLVDSIIQEARDSGWLEIARVIVPTQIFAGAADVPAASAVRGQQDSDKAKPDEKPKQETTGKGNAATGKGKKAAGKGRKPTGRKKAATAAA